MMKRGRIERKIKQNCTQQTLVLDRAGFRVILYVIDQARSHYVSLCFLLRHGGGEKPPQRVAGSCRDKDITGH